MVVVAMMIVTDGSGCDDDSDRWWCASKIILWSSSLERDIGMIEFEISLAAVHLCDGSLNFVLNKFLVFGIHEFLSVKPSGGIQQLLGTTVVSSTLM